MVLDRTKESQESYIFGNCIGIDTTVVSTDNKLMQILPIVLPEIAWYTS